MNMNEEKLHLESLMTELQINKDLVDKALELNNVQNSLVTSKLIDILNRVKLNANDVKKADEAMAAIDAMYKKVPMIVVPDTRKPEEIQKIVNKITEARNKVNQVNQVNQMDTDHSTEDGLLAAALVVQAQDGNNIGLACQLSRAAALNTKLVEERLMRATPVEPQLNHVVTAIFNTDPGYAFENNAQGMLVDGLIKGNMIKVIYIKKTHPV
jgi:hypothetical protein